MVHMLAFLKYWLLQFVKDYAVRTSRGDQLGKTSHALEVSLINKSLRVSVHYPSLSIRITINWGKENQPLLINHAPKRNTESDEYVQFLTYSMLCMLP